MSKNKTHQSNTTKRSSFSGGTTNNTNNTNTANTSIDKCYTNNYNIPDENKIKAKIIEILNK